MEGLCRYSLTLLHTSTDAASCQSTIICGYFDENNVSVLLILFWSLDTASFIFPSPSPGFVRIEVSPSHPLTVMHPMSGQGMPLPITLLIVTTSLDVPTAFSNLTASSQWLDRCITAIRTRNIHASSAHCMGPMETCSRLSRASSRLLHV